MRFNALALASVVFFGNVVFGAPAHDGKEQPAHYSSVQCYTSLTTRPAPYRTRWSTYTTKCTSTKTRTSTVTTESPSPTTTVTTTSTVTATTSTLTETSTVTTTSTDTTTLTDTSTSTETSTSTSTVPTSLGFLPIQTTLPGSGNSGSGGPVVNNKRDVKLDVGVSVGSGTSKNPALQSKKYYPKEVTCHKSKGGKCVNTVTTITTTTTKPAGGTVTSTSTDTTTLFPSATTSVVTTSTETTTSTTVTTTTTTTTEVVVAATPSFAACTGDNLADNLAGDFFNGGFAGPASGGVTVTTTDTAQNCCIAAIQVSNGSVFSFGPSNGRCLIIQAATCPSQATSQFSAILNGSFDPPFTLGNLNCGEVNSAG